MSWGKELFAPVQYNNFEVGPFTASTTIRDDESSEDATNRLRLYLAGVAEEAFTRKRDGFMARLKQVGTAARK